MVKLIFHVGMGKTGTTSLQRALKNEGAILKENGVRYLGMWQEIISSQYQDYAGFQLFLRMPAEQQVNAADKLIERLRSINLKEGSETFIFSNEQYFENIENLHHFFDQLRKHITLQIFIWVRPVYSWLPSACAQWGIYHKTNRGPIQTFESQAIRLIQQYRVLPQWIECFDTSVIVRKFDSSTHPVADFAEMINIPLKVTDDRRQTRPDAIELLLRAAYNNQFDETVLPDAFNVAVGRHKNLFGRTGINDKLNILLNKDKIPEVILQNEALMNQASRAAGFDLTVPAGGKEVILSEAQIFDQLLGRLVEIVAGQARDLFDLKARVEALEKR